MLTPLSSPWPRPARGEPVQPDEIDQGVELCDYLSALLQEDPRPENVLEFPSDRARRLDRESLLASGVILDQLARVKQQLVDVQQGHRGGDIEDIQRFLIEVTMPMWASRARERREARRRGWFSVLNEST